MKIIHLEETLSTNSFLREWSDNHPDDEEAFVFTDSQLAGRGQRGNCWESEPYKNLTMSILITPDFISANRQFILSQAVSLAVKEVLSIHIDHVTIKWPNDIFYRDKKISGILIENDLIKGYISRSIVGIGLNINQIHFLSDAPNPVSLTQITGKQYDIETFALHVSSEIFKKINLLRNLNSVHPLLEKEYFDSLYRKNGFHLFESQQGRFRAKIHRVDPSGLLTLKREDDARLESFAFKEVKYIL